MDAEVNVPIVGVLESSAVASVQTGWAGRGFAFLAVDGNSALLISAVLVHSTSFVPSPLQTHSDVCRVE